MIDILLITVCRDIGEKNLKDLKIMAKVSLSKMKVKKLPQQLMKNIQKATKANQELAKVGLVERIQMKIMEINFNNKMEKSKIIMLVECLLMGCRHCDQDFCRPDLINT
jgi:hypothetical protein